MSRFTKKSTKFLFSYEWNRKLLTKTFVQLGMNKLGQLEDILEKFGIDNPKTLEEILKVHQFLLDHDYSTLPKEELDLLFAKIKALDVIKDNIVKTIDEQLIVNSELDNSITFEFKVNVKTQEDYDLLRKVFL